MLEELGVGSHSDWMRGSIGPGQPIAVAVAVGAAGGSAGYSVPVLTTGMTNDLEQLPEMF
jgi:hypothetical protein